jgi:hypothetical protein
MVDDGRPIQPPSCRPPGRLPSCDPLGRSRERLGGRSGHRPPPYVHRNADRPNAARGDPCGDHWRTVPPPSFRPSPMPSARRNRRRDRAEGDRRDDPVSIQDRRLDRVPTDDLPVPAACLEIVRADGSRPDPVTVASPDGREVMAASVAAPTAARRAPATPAVPPPMRPDVGWKCTRQSLACRSNGLTRQVCPQTSRENLRNLPIGPPSRVPTWWSGGSTGG